MSMKGVERMHGFHAKCFFHESHVFSPSILNIVQCLLECWTSLESEVVSLVNFSSLSVFPSLYPRFPKLVNFAEVECFEKLRLKLCDFHEEI